MGPSPHLTATFFGTATVLLELDDGVRTVRLLTDPVFDDAGAHYHLGPFPYTRLAGPACGPDALPPIDVVLLSHDHHGDNLDDGGRRAAKGAAHVITTPAGARRLRAGGFAQARGLAAWEQTSITVGGLTLIITATPARHGPPLSLPIVGPVTGFLVEWTGQARGPLWISGDTVWHRALEPLTDRGIDVAILHLGAAGARRPRFLRVTMDAREAVEATRVVAPRVVCPVHFEGWSHFQEGRAAVRDQFERAGLADRCVWLPPGEALTLSERPLEPPLPRAHASPREALR